MMLALEGTDMTGKSNIAAELSRRFKVPIFKNSGEWNADLKTPEYFKNLLIYGGTFLTDFLCQVKPNVLLDRYYPSEWVYSRVFNRETDESIIRKIDEKFAGAGGKIVVCRRRSYDGIRDDLHDYIDSRLLEKLDLEYETFLKWTVCRTMTLWVDDFNLDRQVNDIHKFIFKD